jgi:pyruvate,orthophosphate dikinase
MVKVAMDLVDEGMLDDKTALLRIEPNKLDELLHPVFDGDAIKKARVLAKGLPASPGAASGQMVFFADEAEEWVEAGKQVVLVRVETSPEDLRGMNVAKGILTARGGMTSHAAVVARGMGKCCVSGAGGLKIDYKARTMTVDAEKHTKMSVRTNADSPKDSEVARNFGAKGIGLCRTEHMFFEGDRITAMREMILADDEAGRRKALEKLLPIQRADFEGIFEAMHDLPVTVRLLDPPLHEFVPHEEENQQEMAREMGITVEEIRSKVEDLHEFNPMLGHRGCRLGNTYPEISEMQARAVIEAALNLKSKGVKAIPEIMIPLIGTVQEFRMQEDIIRSTAEKVFEERGDKIEYLVGTMIEIPRAAMTADQIAEHAEFFSFGTNDLTQMGFGYSRDDSGKFLPIYVDAGILKHDPFQVLDQEGIGQLVQMGTDKGRSARPDLKVGICGEHGGEPSSVEFCHGVGMNYVSCSPYRVPIARVAAAQAAIKQG